MNFDDVLPTPKSFISFSPIANMSLKRKTIEDTVIDNELLKKRREIDIMPYFDEKAAQRVPLARCFTFVCLKGDEESGSDSESEPESEESSESEEDTHEKISVRICLDRFQENTVDLTL
jgi:hypothetical protein